MSRYFPPRSRAQARNFATRTTGDGGGRVRKRISIGLLLAFVGALALMAAGCGGGGDEGGGGGTTGGGGGGGGNVSALPASSCAPLQYKGSGDPDYLIASDLPKQGGSRT